MRKFLIGAVAVASIVGGSAAVAAVNPLVIAGAQNDPGTTSPTTAAPATPPSSVPGTPDPSGKRGPRGDNPLKQTLDELVANGTITQAQADAITNGVKAKIEAGKGAGHPGPGGAGGHPGKGGPGFGFDRQDVVNAAAAAIGIDAAALKTEMGNGTSLADVAKAHGVDPQKVIDAIVTAGSANIDAAVAAGKIPADRAEAIKEKLAAHAQDLVTKAPGSHKPRGG